MHNESAHLSSDRTSGRTAPVIGPRLKRRTYNMPPNRNRGNNPHGRQKSCSECVKAKRRCDLRQPHCLRCTRQKLTCSYPPQPDAPKSTTPDSSVATPIVDDSVLDDPAPLVFDIDIPEITAADTELLNFDFDAAVNPPSSCDGQDLDHALIVDVPTSRSTSSSTNTSPMFSTVMLSPLAQSRMDYPFEQLKQAPRTFVETNAMHWSHPMLYDDYMPKALQDAYASCALYIARNETNATFIARHVTERAQLLVDQPLPVSPLEVVARVQALMLYLIILTCGGDMRYFGQADKLLPYLQDGTTALSAISSNEKDPLSTLVLYPSSVARDAWQSFIFRESCRRTLLVAYQAIGICNLLKGKLCSCERELAAGIRVVISSALWEAKSPFEFALAWNGQKHIVVKDLDFEQVLKEANANDVDVFARMMMTGILGVDEVRAWIHTRGGQL